MARTTLKKRSTENLAEDRLLDQVKAPASPVLNEAKKPSPPPHPPAFDEQPKPDFAFSKPIKKEEDFGVQETPKADLGTNGANAQTHADLAQNGNNVPQRRFYPLSTHVWTPCPQHRGFSVCLCATCHFNNTNAGNNIELFPDGSGRLFLDTCPGCSRMIFEPSWNTTPKPFYLQNPMF